MFNKKKRREQDRQFYRQMREIDFALARAMAEEGLTGEYRERTLKKIAEAERKFKEEGATR